jgi:hypothetical protein
MFRFKLIQLYAAFRITIMQWAAEVAEAVSYQPAWSRVTLLAYFAC